MQKGDRELEIGGTLQQKILSCLDVMDRFMTEGNTIVSSMVVAEKRCAVTTSGNLVETIASMIGNQLLHILDDLGEQQCSL